MARATASPIRVRAPAAEGASQAGRDGSIRRRCCRASSRESAFAAAVPVFPATLKLTAFTDLLVRLTLVLLAFSGRQIELFPRTNHVFPQGSLWLRTVKWMVSAATAVA